MKDLIFRDLRIEDYDALIELWKAAGLSYRPKGRDSREHVAKEIEQPMAIFIVAEVKGKMVGSLLGTTDGRKGWINRLAVLPQYRRRGLAKRLVQEIEARFSSKGLEIYSCIIQEDNQVSKELFESLGYKNCAEDLYYSKRKDQSV